MKNILRSAYIICCLAMAATFYAQEKPLANSVLWKIEGNNITTSSYLMGTIHLMCEEDFKIKDKIKIALSESEDLVLEVNFDDPKEIALIQKTMMSDKKLSETLTKKQAEKLDSILAKSMGVGIENFDQFSLSTLYSLILMQSISCPNKKMWEMELIALAKTNEMEIFGLESIIDQIDFFTNAYPTDEMINQLDLMDEYAEIFGDIVDLYNTENISKLVNVIDDPRFMDENAEYWMLEYRNKNWLKKMQQMMEGGSQFFAVGSAHLAGEFGLIPQLRKLGYTVTPVFD